MRYNTARQAVSRAVGGEAAMPPRRRRLIARLLQYRLKSPQMKAEYRAAHFAAAKQFSPPAPDFTGRSRYMSWPKYTERWRAISTHTTFRFSALAFCDYCRRAVYIPHFAGRSIHISRDYGAAADIMPRCRIFCYYDCSKNSLRQGS